MDSLQIAFQLRFLSCNKESVFVKYTSCKVGHFYSQVIQGNVGLSLTVNLQEQILLLYSIISEYPQLWNSHTHFQDLWVLVESFYSRHFKVSQLEHILVAQFNGELNGFGFSPGQIKFVDSQRINWLGRR